MSNRVLTMEEIAEIQAHSRKRGSYDITLKDFVEAEVPGIEVSLTEGEFTGKSATTVYQGFNSKVGEGTSYERITVKNRDGRIFLLNLALAG